MRWTNIFNRCYVETHDKYHRYEGRGIRVHQEWLDDPIMFMWHMMTIDGWDNLRLEIDRIDNDGHYEPGNLRMVTQIRNKNNRSGGVRLIYLDKSYTVTELHQQHFSHLRHQTVYDRAKKGKLPGVKFERLPSSS